MRGGVLFWLMVLAVVLPAAVAWADVDRISPGDARLMVEEGKALLICAYEDARKCAESRLEGSIDLVTLKRVEKGLKPDFTLVFY